MKKRPIYLTFLLLTAFFSLIACTGPQGPEGPQGPQGETGETGLQGEPGKDGQDGKDGNTPYIGDNGNWWIGDTDTGVPARGPEGPRGEPGKDGTSMHTGHGVPCYDLGQVGDSYVDLDTWDFYVKYENGWVLEGNIKGSDHEGTEGLEFYPINDKECAVSVGTAKLLKNIIIPSTYKNFKVTEILECGFQSSKVETIIIPNSVTSIGDSAFNVCTSLTSITIPDSVASIGDGAFEGCSSLTSVDIPDSVTSIGSSAFSGCTSLQYNEYSYCNYLGNNTNPYHVLIRCKRQTVKTYQINLGCKLIYQNAFNCCSSLTSIILPDSVISIGDYAFAYCSSLTSITIPDSVASIGDCAFTYCTSLTSIILPGSVPSIGDDIFHNCTSFTNVYYTGTIENWCNISFGDVYYNPMSYAQHFYMLNKSNEWYEVTEIVIPDSVTIIGNFQFCGFNSITSITIPDSVTSIGYWAFYDCTSFTNVYYTGTIENWCNISFGDDLSNPNNYAQHFYMLNKSNEWYEVTEIVIPDSVTIIGNFQFCGFNSITSITIPDSVTSIGYGAFEGCTSLTSVDIPDNVTSIGYGTFFYCTSLTSITIPDSVTSIGDSAFLYCTSLTSITIPDSVISIGYGAFYYCTSLTSIILPDSVISIGDSAFSYCDSLTIYCEVTSQPTGWCSQWNGNRLVYWGGQWEYDNNNNPTPII